MLHDVTQEQKNLYLLLLLQLLFLPNIILYVQKSIDSELLMVDISVAVRNSKISLENFRNSSKLV